MTVPYRIHFNPLFRQAEPYGDARREIVSLASQRRAVAEITGWPGYEPTPLIQLGGVARALGLGTLWYKDEGPRFGLGSFKALGGAYGVLQALRQRGLGAPSTQSDVEARSRDVTVTTATDGNHGRSVAWGAKLFGCRAVIYLPAAVSTGRERAIQRLGGETVRVDGNYDDAVVRAQQDADRYGYLVVSDTSYPGYADIPRFVMQGYGVISHELESQLDGTLPTHVMLQGGVGAFAASILGHYWDRWGAERPAVIVVEPHEADCLLQSARAGRPTRVAGEHRTIMAGLAAGQVSLLAWPILETGARAFMTVGDHLAARAMRVVGDGRFGDPPIVAGESAVAGLAALLALQNETGVRDELGLTQAARVLLIGTEGATDADAYERIVGRPPQ